MVIQTFTEFIDAVSGDLETHRLDDTIHDVNEYWIRTKGPPSQIGLHLGQKKKWITN